MTYQLILADPPWSYSDKSLNRGGAERHYSTMPISEIQALPVKELAADNAILAMWATFPLLPEAISTVASWGFQYKTVLFVWVKTSQDRQSMLFGMGHHTRANAEVMLLGIKGRGLTRHDASILNVQCYPRERHSAKPYAFHLLLERLYGDVSRVELFARERRVGWDVLMSNEVDGG